MTQNSRLREKTQSDTLKWACNQDQSFDLEVNVYINIYKIMQKDPINVRKTDETNTSLAFLHNEYFFQSSKNGGCNKSV